MVLVPAIKHNALTSALAQSLLSMLANKLSGDRASEEAEKQREFTAGQNEVRATTDMKKAQLRRDSDRDKQDLLKLRERTKAIGAQDPLAYGEAGGGTKEYVDAIQAKAFGEADEVESKAKQAAGVLEAKPPKTDPLKLENLKHKNRMELRKTPAAPRPAPAGKDPMSKLTNTISELGSKTAKYASPTEAWKKIGPELSAKYEARINQEVSQLSPDDKAAIKAEWERMGKPEGLPAYIEAITNVTRSRVKQ